jgi:hypothetical protein
MKFARFRAIMNSRTCSKIWDIVLKIKSVGVTHHHADTSLKIY